MTERIPYLLLFYPVLLFSLSFHEAAHGWMAGRFGDHTARLMGRVTLNPIPHMDMIGTLILPVFAILTGAPLIGWGKPVPVNPMNLKDPRRDELWIAALGPLSNICLAVLFAMLGRGELFLLEKIGGLNAAGFAGTAAAAVYTVARMGVTLNLALAVFNMIPLYPLDGGSVIRGLLPERFIQSYDRLARQSVFLLLILFVSGALKYIFIPVYLLAGLMLPM